MLAFFKIAILLFFINSCEKLVAEDLLYKRILLYNHVKEKPITIVRPDSSKLLYNLGVCQNGQQIKYTKQIIKKRNSPTDLVVFFSSVLFIIIIVLIRMNVNTNYFQQLSDYYTLKLKSFESYSIFKTVIINLVFVLIISHIITTLKYNDAYTLFDKSRFLKFLIVTTSLLLAMKYFTNFILARVFNLNEFVSTLNFLWADSISIFASISLPLILIGSIRNTSMNEFILIGTIILLISIYLFSIIKLLYNEVNILKRNVINLILYIYTVEFIPLVLLVKYFKNI